MMEKDITIKIKEYMNRQSISQAYVSIVTGIERTKLNRILNNKQDVSYDEAKLISGALGQTVGFFEGNNTVPVYQSSEKEITFYAGSPTDQQKEFARDMISFLETVDYIVGAEDRINDFM